ncbi:hypothetical protein ScPMuIL_015427 [Solemya velum]
MRDANEIMNTFFNRGPNQLNQVILGILLISFYRYTDAKRCMRNADIGWRPGNVYTCDDPVLTECCERYSKFTCCEVNYQRNV